MNTQSLRLGAAFNLLRQTWPILLVRLGASIVFWLVAIIYFLILGGISFLIGQAIQILGVIVFFVGLIGVGALYQLAYKYVFFMLKAAHIAVMGELLANEQLPEGMGQLNYGREKVTERFGEMNAMFVVDELVTGVIKAFTRTVYQVASFLPGDTLDTLIKVVNRVIEFAMSYIDEAILARSFYRERESIWENARDGLVLYAMVWKPILMNAIALMIISYIPFVVAIILFSAPVGFFIAIFNSSLAGWSIILTLVLAWLVKVAIGDSFAMAAIISTYYHETQGLTPNPEMAGRLESVSDKFRELTERAGESLGIGGEQPATPEPTAPDTPASPPQPPAQPRTPPAQPGTTPNQPGTPPDTGTSSAGGTE